MDGARGRWRTMEHTADLAVEVEAPGVLDLFIACARALAGLLIGQEESDEGDAAADPEVWRDLSLEAPDREALLVEWLRELLHIQTSEGVLFSAAELEEAGERRLRARAGFASAGDGAVFQRELKGVTYHDLELRERDDGWYARVVFDL